ncbi:UNVERIFIED_CONTAM: hypothetical protein GTU68_054810, partial [Idotea baltica]|nr:hypothetical protein [Idotea baltica]
VDNQVVTQKIKPWSARLAPYRRPDNKRAVIEIAITVVPLVALWLTIFGLFHVDTVTTHIAALLALVPAAGLMVRLFIIQHDCGHGSMFSSRRANDWVGRVLGIVTMTPYEYWRSLHAEHHASSGNLDRRGMGDIDTLTVDEYLNKGIFGRVLYRLYRHPAVMFGLGPAYLFLLRHRLPVGAMKAGVKPWVSTIANNIGIVVMSAVLIYFTSWTTFLIIQIPIVVIGASIGVWMFYVQHQFDETTWERNPTWKHEYAALHGSSYYDLPKPLMWITGNIGIHHVHHLSSRIPFHKLPQVVKDHPELAKIGRLTLLDSLRCVRLTLWDEQKQKLISFRDLKGGYATAA